MNPKDKLRVLLDHWIDHNRGHGEECAKWASIARQEGLDETAGLIDEAIVAMEKTNSSLQKALEKAGGAKQVESGHHHHHDH